MEDTELRGGAWLGGRRGRIDCEEDEGEVRHVSPTGLTILTILTVLALQ